MNATLVDDAYGTKCTAMFHLLSSLKQGYSFVNHCTDMDLSHTTKQEVLGSNLDWTIS
jgi:hypothetical protein